MDNSVGRLLAAVLATVTLIVGCAAPPASGGQRSDALSTPPSAVPAPSSTSAYPAGWATGMCVAYGELLTRPIGLSSGAAGRARIAAALVALAKVPSWVAGDESRDALIDWYQQMAAAFELNDQDPVAAIDASIAALDELGTVGHSLDALEAATGERLPCRAT